MLTGIIRDVFIKDVPEWRRLEPEVRSWLADASFQLSDILHGICDRLVAAPDTALDKDRHALRDPMATALEIVDGLVERLDVTETNRDRLLAYVQVIHCYSAYDRLMTDFRRLLRPEQAAAVFTRGKTLFIADLTKGWEETA